MFLKIDKKTKVSYIKIFSQFVKIKGYSFYSFYLKNDIH